MKFMITYFYNIRHLEKNMVPFSTAIWDPKWFHDGREKDYAFFDKRGIMNGLRLDGTLVPDIIEEEVMCSGKDGCKFTPDTCEYLSRYLEKLRSINFREFLGYCESVAKDVLRLAAIDEEPVAVLTVYEKPDNPCSERVAIKKWFEENCMDIPEFEKSTEDGD